LQRVPEDNVNSQFSGMSEPDVLWDDVTTILNTGYR
jgi:hypothetical protein